MRGFARKRSHAAVFQVKATLKKLDQKCQSLLNYESECNGNDEKTVFDAVLMKTRFLLDAGLA